ncbi:hypothetical protein [Streptomyces sp. NPDC093707]|uniref:hypothetical protein n=1 Tax=Streptomyces sp. NPDC093707 TaxID=3154984 RepID=UPI00344E8E8F
MATFHAIPGLEQALAKMLAPQIHEVAREVEREARRLAPPTKRWVTVADDNVRPTHAQAHGQERPANLRFEINSMDWDRRHRGVGPVTYMMSPRDESSRAVANLKNCRCTAQRITDGIARNIHALLPTVTGTRVTAKVVATGRFVVEAEVGTIYPGNLQASGAHYMARAAAAVAARR